MKVKYKGKNIFIKLMKYDIEAITFCYNHNIIIYINKDRFKREFPKVLHKTLNKK